MSKHSAKRNPLVPRARGALVPRERDALVPHERDAVPLELDADAVELMHRAPDGWFSFRYSYTEISTTGRGAHLKSKRARYEDGKLSTESFEADVDRGVYERMMDDAQRLFVRQASLFQQMLTAFLPAPRRRDQERDGN